jgi:L-alanine-DL-glutamate epimerase-like enolase superfamily enzyme
MKIESIRTALYRVPPATQWRDASYDVDALEFVIVELQTRTGLRGVGYSYSTGDGGSAVKSLIDDSAVAVLAGMNAFDVERIWGALQRRLHRTGSGGVNTMALAAIDIAVWDLIAKSHGLPLYRVLGGFRDSIQAYGSGVDLFMTCEELREHVEAYVQQGYSAVKIKVGRPSLAEDVERVRTARDVLGPKGMLLLDANQRWRLDEAVHRLRALERFDPFWIEEPLRPEDIEGHAHLRRSTGVPVAVGESLYTKHQFLDYLRAEAADVLQPDVGRVGGITEWMKIAHLCEAWNRSVAPHFLFELSTHLLCAVPNGLILENVTGGSLTELGFLSRPIRIENACAMPSQEAGHGILFDYERMQPFRVDREPSSPETCARPGPRR